MTLDQLRKNYPSATSREAAMEQAAIYERFAREDKRKAPTQAQGNDLADESHRHAENLKQLARLL